MGLAAVAAAAVLWALIGVCTSELDDLGLPAVQVGPWRALIGGACFAVQAVLGLRRSCRGSARSTGKAPGGGAGGGSGGGNGRPPGDGSGGGSVGDPGEGSGDDFGEDSLGGPRRAGSGIGQPAGEPPRRSIAEIGGILRARWMAVLAFCLLGVVVFYTALPLAVDTGGISLAYVLLYTAPIWVSIGAVLWLDERLGPAQLVAVGASVAGVAAIALSAGGTLRVTPASMAWGLLAGISYSSYYLLGRRLFEAVDPAVLYAVVLLAGGILLAAAFGLDPPGWEMVPWLLLLGVGCTWAPYHLFSLGITRVPSSRAVVVAMIEPVLATAIGVAFYGERLGWVGLVGVAVVLAASTRSALASTSGTRSEPGAAAG